jgi:hypothetical protein
MRYLPQEAFVALTDRAWFDFLSARAASGRLDEVNFWFPRATRPMKRMTVGEPLFFRLKRPDHVDEFRAIFGAEPFTWELGDLAAGLPVRKVDR